jgi:hypothetical protein
MSEDIHLYKVSGINNTGMHYVVYQLAESPTDVTNFFDDMNPHATPPVIEEQPLAMIRNTLPPRMTEASYVPF